MTIIDELERLQRERPADHDSVLMLWRELSALLRVARAAQAMLDTRSDEQSVERMYAALSPLLAERKESQS